jgi:hypothetical protein
MSRKLKELEQKGHAVDAEVLKGRSPSRRERINRICWICNAPCRARSDHRSRIQISGLHRAVADF